MNNMQNDINIKERKCIFLLFLFSTSLFLLLQQGTIENSDGYSMYCVTRAIIEEKTVRVPPECSEIKGRDGNYYVKYGIGLSLVAIPFYLIGEGISGVIGHKKYTTMFLVASVIPIICSFIVVAMYLLARKFKTDRYTSLLVAFGAVCGTYFLPYIKDFFSEPLATLGIILAIERTIKSHPIQAGFFLGLSALARPQLFILFPIFCWWIWSEKGFRDCIKILVPLSIFLIIALGYNFVRFGSIFDFGYHDEGFTSQFLKSGKGLLFSPAKSVFLFAPVSLLLPFSFNYMWKVHKYLTIVLSANLCAMFILTAKWWSWTGGWSWGPRLLIPGLLPALITIAPWINDSKIKKQIAVLLFVVGFLISAPTILVSIRAQQLDLPPPEVGPTIIRQYQLIFPTLQYTAKHIFEYIPGQGEHRKFVNLWQVGMILALKKGGVIISLLGTGVLLFIIGISGIQLFKIIRNISE